MLIFIIILILGVLMFGAILIISIDTLSCESHVYKKPDDPFDQLIDKYIHEKNMTPSEFIKKANKLERIEKLKKLNRL